MKKPLFTVLVVFVAAAAWAGSVVPPPGYVCVDTPIAMPAGSWFGGFDILPNGNFVISDGWAVREIALSGADVRMLYAYPSQVYGSFVKYNPVSSYVYFGESSSGTIMSVPASGGAARVVATVAYNYDLDFWDSRPYAVGLNNIYLVDEETGDLDLIASAGTVSGPLIFDSAGNLVYGPGNPNWPPTTDDQSIYAWSAAQVAAAIGPGSLTEADASVLASNVDAPSGFAFKPGGGLLYTDSQVSPGVIRLVEDGSCVTWATVQVPDAPAWVTTIRSDLNVGRVSAAVSWFDSNWQSHTVISTLVPVPEPSSAAALCALIGLPIMRLPVGSRNAILSKRNTPQQEDTTCQQ